jgi:exosortase
VRRVIWRELGLASLIGTVVAVSPMTSHRLLPALAAGAVAGGATFAYRLRRRAEPREGAAAAAHRVTVRDAIPGMVILAGALYLALLTPVLVWLYRHWTTGVWVNNHGLFVPLIVGYLVYVTLKRDPRPHPEASPWGFPLVAAGLFLVAIDAGMGNRYLAVIGLLLTLPGLSLLLLGARRTRELAVPLAVSLMAMPIPNTVASHLYLRQITSIGVEEILHVLAIPAVREATLITTAHHNFIVSDACSGFATLYASVAVAVILACYSRSHWRRMLLILAVVPLAVAANIVRVFFLVVITDRFGAWILDTPIHPASGVATFVVVLIGFFVIADRSQLRRSLT